MKESQLKARKTNVINNLKTKELLTSYEKQTAKEKLATYIDKRKRVE